MVPSVSISSISQSPAETKLFILGNLKLLSLPYDHHPSFIAVCPSVCVLISKCVLFKSLLWWVPCPPHWNALLAVDEMVLVPLDCVLALSAPGFGSDPALIYSTGHGLAQMLLYHAPSHCLSICLSLCLPVFFILTCEVSICHLNFLQTCRKEWDAHFPQLGCLVLSCDSFVFCHKDSTTWWMYAKFRAVRWQ